MIGRLVVLAMLVWGKAALAAPVPPPPEGFAGGQYIDGRGCVFTRDGAGWAARLDGQGQGLCGFPPSLDTRRTDPDTERVLPLSVAPPPDIETLLMEQLARDLRPGEWSGDPRPAEIRREPEPARAPNPLQTALQDALDMAPALRQASGLSGNLDLCARLGYRPDAEGVAQGSTLGLCPGMRAETMPSALSIGARASAERATPAPTPAPVAVSARPQQAAPARPSAASASAPAPRAPARVAPAPTATAPARPAIAVNGPEMIPPWARYVQIGAYSDDAKADAALHQLAARGYPAGQGRAQGGTAQLRLIMAGPFGDRQSLITALNDLRRNGYPGAVAR